MYVPLNTSSISTLGGNINAAFGGLATDINSTLINNLTPLETKLDSLQNVVEALLKDLNSVHTFNRNLIFKILILEGKFSKEEVDNLQSMLNSNDNASIELAKEILKNEGYAYEL
jgi:hypothetical protein